MLGCVEVQGVWSVEFPDGAEVPEHVIDTKSCRASRGWQASSPIWVVAG